MRQVVLDTETTGLKEGSRIIEIGCIELIERKLTGRHYHVYINPQMAIEEEALQVHGISNAWLEEQKAPVFSQVADEFRQFIAGAELVIHNAAFDIGKMNYEFGLLGLSRTETFCTVLDTLTMARDFYPGSRHTLDALCKRFDIDNSHRQLHGALLDAEILADVYLAMTGGQTALELAVEQNAQGPNLELDMAKIDFAALQLKVIKASVQELQEHERFLDLLDKKSGQAVWRRGNCAPEQ